MVFFLLALVLLYLMLYRGPEDSTETNGIKNEFKKTILQRMKMSFLKPVLSDLLMPSVTEICDFNQAYGFELSHGIKYLRN